MSIEFKDPSVAAQFTVGHTFRLPLDGYGWMDVEEQERLNPGIQWDDDIITDPRGKRWGRLRGTVERTTTTLVVTGVDYETGTITVKAKP